MDLSKKYEQGTSNISEIRGKFDEELTKDLMSKKNDFLIQIYEGDMLFPDQRGYSVLLKIKKANDYFIDFEGTRYEINQDIFDNLKILVKGYLEELVKYSAMQTCEYLMENVPEGGNSLYIHIKYGSLIIKLNGNVKGEIKDFCKEFLEKVKEAIV